MDTYELDDIQVWVACLSCYNDGKLTGSWEQLPEVEAADSPHDLTGCTIPGHEEYAFHDVEDPAGLFEALAGKGEPTLREVLEVLGVATDAERIGADLEAVAVYLDYGNDWDPQRFNDSYCGQHDDFTDYARELASDVGYFDDTSPMVNYIDWEKFARDLLMDYYHDRGHVFRIM